jgi:hypothetical protein
MVLGMGQSNEKMSQARATRGEVGTDRSMALGPCSDIMNPISCILGHR